MRSRRATAGQGHKKKDIALWAAATELAPELIGPTVAGRLSGTARDLIREVPTDQLRDGRVDPATGKFKQA